MISVPQAFDESLFLGDVTAQRSFSKVYLNVDLDVQLVQYTYSEQ